MLSRNFRLQRVGGLEWLQRNYNFSQIAFYIDELVVLDVSRGERNIDYFCSTLQALTKGCFVPITAGGGLQSVNSVRKLLHSGADKVLVNTVLFDTPDLVVDMAKEFGQQCIVGSMDVKWESERGRYSIFTMNGSKRLDMAPVDVLAELSSGILGELYLNSIDRDGTGQGYDFDILELLPENWSNPVILAGGVGNSNHLIEGLLDTRVDAVATANLFNFVGNGLQRAREAILRENISLASWPPLAELPLGIWNEENTP